MTLPSTITSTRLPAIGRNRSTAGISRSPRVSRRPRGSSAAPASTSIPSCRRTRQRSCGSGSRSRTNRTESCEILRASSGRRTDPRTHFLIQGDILTGRCAPRQIRGHGALDDRLPASSAMIEPDRPSNRLEEGVGGVLAKRESVPLGRVPCHVDDGVSQAARGTDDRDRAVAEADHLSQTTRLELRGHQEEIGTCVDPMREGLVILQPDHQVAPYSGELGHRFFVLLLPRAKEDELDSLVQDLRKRLDQDVEPFLRRDPRDVSDQRRFRILGEARLLLKGSLVRSLSLQGGFRVLLGQERILRRIPYVVIDAV